MDRIDVTFHIFSARYIWSHQHLSHQARRQEKFANFDQSRDISKTV